MAKNIEEWKEVVQKIDYEGGLCEYILYYGGDMPKEFSKEVQQFIDAYNELLYKLEEEGFPI